jgi:DNA topoisomerase-1
MADNPVDLEELGLVYSLDDRPGIERRRAGKGFAYRHPNGERVGDKRTLDRISALVIPPAWTDVWINPRANGHLQVTGRDQKGRKQSLYHPDFRAHREETKFARLGDFGRALPLIRSRVDHDLRRRGLSKERVTAVAVHLLEATLIRIGNREYAEKNGSFGLTTLQAEHLDLGTEKLCFHFRGKSGKEHQIEYRNPRAARLLRQCQELPGQTLFQYLDEEGQPASISSEDINAYLREASGDDFTAKHFRTWAATRETLRLLRELPDPTPAVLPGTIKQIAKLLGNTPSVCRSSYIHPALLEPWTTLPEWLSAPIRGRTPAWLDPIEALALRTFLHS